MASSRAPVAKEEEKQMDLVLSLEDTIREDLIKTLQEKNMQFRYKSVEDALAPLIMQVTSLTDSHSSEVVGNDGKAEEGSCSVQLQASGRFWLGRPHKLVQLVDKAIMNLLAVADNIGKENPKFQTDLVVACEVVRSKGELVHEVAIQFVANTAVQEKRTAMTSAARELLLSVTKLLVIVDIIDVDNILAVSSRIEKKIQVLRKVKNEAELTTQIKDFEAEVAQITQVATLYQHSSASLQLLTTVQTDLNKATRMLVSASKAFLHSPAEKAAEDNKELIVEDMLRSLHTLTLLTSGEDPSHIESEPHPGKLAVSFSKFEDGLDKISLEHSPSVAASLQKEFEVILKTAAEMANSESTRDYRQRSIIMKCDTLKSELQRLIAVEEDRNEGENDNVKKMVSSTRNHLHALRKELLGVCVDHMSDAFVMVLHPMEELAQGAREGDRRQVNERATNLEEHASRLLKSASLSCLFLMDINHIKMINMTSRHISALAPQMVRAAETLVAQPSSITLKKNMSIFQESWVENVQLLIKSVDMVTPLLEFITVTEAHVCGDGVSLLQAASSGEAESFWKSVHLVQGRCARLSHVVRADIRRNRRDYQADQKRHINECIDCLEKDVLAFKGLAQTMKLGASAGIGTNDESVGKLTEATEKVVKIVRSLHASVLATRSLLEREKEELMDTEAMLPRSLTVSAPPSAPPPEFRTPRKFKRTPHHSAVFNTGGESAEAVMTQLTPEQKSVLEKAAAGLTAQQKKMETEVQKWDVENDMVVLAKEICMMIMDMSNFTRGTGRLQSMMDLAITAKDIVRAGKYLWSIALSIAEQCPDDKAKGDLQAHVDKMKLCSHQLKITSAVRVDSKTSASHTVDSASSLIVAAKNLLDATVETVKTSYIASAAITRLHGGTLPDQFSMWRLTLPKKKALQAAPTEKESSAPIHQLGQFRPGKHML